ncbi:hypothetical protein M426DRAFT_76567 [Hypoxylon sp. CI-4A]|nr:hypothetical protein M426DRAFT_76567 [Hypoxylon sp. CI-4A]
MPTFYRAPEIILGMEWDSKIDIWSVATMIWDLLEGLRLFYAKSSGHLNDEQHLAEMSLETRADSLTGKDQELLLILFRKIMRWLPEDRPTAEDLYKDEFLLQCVRKE